MEWLRHLTMVDYLILTALLVSFAVGWARGMVDMLTGFITFLVTMFVAGRYTGYVVAWMNRTWAAEDRLAVVLERRINLPAEAFKVPASSVPWSKALEWLREVPIPEASKQALAQQLSDWSQSAGLQTAAKYIVQQVAAGVITAVVFVVLGLLIGWVLGLLGRLVSDQIKEIPLAGTANRLTGAVANVIQTAVVLSILAALVVPTLSIYGLKNVGSAVQNAQLAPYLLTFFEWVGTLLFGVGNDSFFV